MVWISNENRRIYEVTKIMNEKLNKNKYLLLSWCPFTYLRINKFWNAFIIQSVLFLIGLIVGTISTKFIDFRPLPLILLLIIYLTPMCFLMNKWIDEWNKKQGVKT
jgi:hypothetical protein